VSKSAGDRQTLTFVVRMWRETNSSGHTHWRGRVEHVASQQVEYIQDLAALTRFIERWTGEPDTAPGSTTGG